MSEILYYYTNNIVKLSSILVRKKIPFAKFYVQETGCPSSTLTKVDFRLSTYVATTTDLTPIVEKRRSWLNKNFICKQLFLFELPSVEVKVGGIFENSIIFKTLKNYDLFYVAENLYKVYYGSDCLTDILGETRKPDWFPLSGVVKFNPKEQFVQIYPSLRHFFSSDHEIYKIFYVFNSLEEKNQFKKRIAFERLAR